MERFEAARSFGAEFTAQFKLPIRSRYEKARATFETHLKNVIEGTYRFNKALSFDMSRVWKKKKLLE